MPFCPLNVTNRMAYNMLDTLMIIADAKPILNFHVPSVGIDPAAELRRREKMIKQWTLVIKSDRDFVLNKDVPPPFMIKEERKYTNPQ